MAPTPDSLSIYLMGTTGRKGSQKGHSTETTLLRVVSCLLQAFDSWDSCHVSILSLLDLSAAFDTIDHGILIKKLHTILGCSGTVRDWFTS